MKALTRIIAVILGLSGTAAAAFVLLKLFRGCAAIIGIVK